MLKNCIFLILLLFTMPSFGQLNGNEILGKWITEEKNAIFECYKNNGKYFAKLIWYKPFDEKTEGRKIDPIENTKYLNMLVMKDFVFDTNEWNNGLIVDVYENKSYTSFIKLIKPARIKITGYVFFRWLSRSLILNRYP